MSGWRLLYELREDVGYMGNSKSNFAVVELDEEEVYLLCRLQPLDGKQNGYERKLVSVHLDR